jgi:hypothetical protein
MMEFMGDFVMGVGEMMDGMAEANPDLVPKDSENADGEPGQYRRQATQQLIQMNEWVNEGGGNETFGLFLTDIKYPEGPSNDLTELQGLAHMIGGFTLDAGGIMDDTPVLTRLEVSPGQRDNSGNRIVYVWRQGETPGSAEISTKTLNDDMIAGQIVGELYTEKPPFRDRRQLKITVRAEFVALRGQLARMASH